MNILEALAGLVAIGIVVSVGLAITVVPVLVALCIYFK